MIVHDTREAEFVGIVRSEQDAALLRQHVREVVEGSVFKASHRSSQFLSYIVDQAIAGHFDALKERVIGVELFGRNPSYDTGEDAIVRVTASDVRKRLLQHYGKYGFSSEFEIRLPSGSYLPKIARNRHNGRPVAATASADFHSQPPFNNPPAVHENRFEPAHAICPDSEPEAWPSWLKKHAREILWLSIGILLVAVGIAVWTAFGSHSQNHSMAQTSVLPWSAFFRSPHPSLLVTSDPDIADVQFITHQRISVSDYANHDYFPDPNAVSPGIRSFLRSTLRGDKSASVDTPIAVGIAELAVKEGSSLTVRPSRDIQLSDLATGDNLIFLGSPESNPWSALYNDQLAFKFAWDEKSGQEVIVNEHPRSHELSRYVPTALGFATGQSFAIVAMVQQLHQSGQVLLLAGASAEGTAAAGMFVTDIPWLSATLKKCGVYPQGPLRHFEILLRVSTMAGSSSRIDVEACRVL